MPTILSRRLFLALAACTAARCGGTSNPNSPSVTTASGRLSSRPHAERTTLSPGPHQITSSSGVSDGMIYVPFGANLAKPLPFAVMLHGGGGNELGMDFTLPLADEFGVALLVPNSRGKVWDAVVSPFAFGADAAFIDSALARTFAGCAIDPARVTIGGLSDGATYALALGLLNGDLFTRVVAFSAGFLHPADRYGKPRVFISHGTRDGVFNIDLCGRVIVHQLLGEGYDVTYREFDGGHEVPDGIARQAFAWLS